ADTGLISVEDAEHQANPLREELRGHHESNVAVDHELARDEVRRVRQLVSLAGKEILAAEGHAELPSGEAQRGDLEPDRRYDEKSVDRLGVLTRELNLELEPRDAP